MNKTSPLGKPFLSFPRYGKRFIDTKTRSKITNHNFSFDIEIVFSFLKQFRQIIVVASVKRELKLLRHDAQNLQYKNFQKRWLDLIADIVLGKVYKNLDKQINKSSIYPIPVYLLILIPFCMKMVL